MFPKSTTYAKIIVFSSLKTPISRQLPILQASPFLCHVMAAEPVELEKIFQGMILVPTEILIPQASEHVMFRHWEANFAVSCRASDELVAGRMTTLSRFSVSSLIFYWHFLQIFDEMLEPANTKEEKWHPLFPNVSHSVPMTKFVPFLRRTLRHEPRRRSNEWANVNPHRGASWFFHFSSLPSI